MLLYCMYYVFRTSVSIMIVDRRRRQCRDQMRIWNDSRRHRTKIVGSSVIDCWYCIDSTVGIIRGQQRGMSIDDIDDDACFVFIGVVGTTTFRSRLHSLLIATAKNNSFIRLFFATRGREWRRYYRTAALIIYFVFC